jgi:hypothetical protein
LYEGTVPATDRSPKGLAMVYPDALRQVAVRVTGRPAAAADPALAPLYADANRFVQTWRPAGSGQVAVGFDAQAVEAALVAAGQPLWPADRPVVFAVVMVERAGPGGVVRTLLTGAVTGDERRALERVAQARGLVLAWPAVELAPALTDLAQSGPVDALLSLAREQKAQAVLWLRTSAVAGSAPQWSWATDSLAGSGRSDAATALQGFADALAARDASAPGAALAQLVVVVSGVDSLADYAAVLNAIEGLPTVRELGVMSVAGNVVRLRVAIEPEISQATGGDDEVTRDHRGGQPDGRLSEQGHYHEYGHQQEFVGERVEALAQFRLPRKALGEITIEDIGEGRKGEYQQGQRQTAMQQ